MWEGHSLRMAMTCVSLWCLLVNSTHVPEIATFNTFLTGSLLLQIHGSLTLLKQVTPAPGQGRQHLSIFVYRVDEMSRELELFTSKNWMLTNRAMHLLTTQISLGQMPIGRTHTMHYTKFSGTTILMSTNACAFANLLLANLNRNCVMYPSAIGAKSLWHMHLLSAVITLRSFTCVRDADLLKDNFINSFELIEYF